MSWLYGAGVPKSIAPDRFGKKPLHYTSAGNSFIFTSELKSFCRHPAVKMDIDRLTLAKYFAHYYIPAPRTIIKGIFKLEAGHYIVVKDGAVADKRYWDFRFDLGFLYYKARNYHIYSRFADTDRLCNFIIKRSADKNIVSECLFF